MVRPLEVVIQELEQKYEGKELKYNLETRDRICLKYDAMASYILEVLEHYEFDVKSILDFGLSKSMISHLTYNLVLQLIYYLDHIQEYQYVLVYYLLDERYKTNSKYLDDFENDINTVGTLLENLESDSFFNSESYKSDYAFDKEYLKGRLGKQKKPKFRLEKSISYLNGEQLLGCAQNLLTFVRDEFYTIKNGTTYYKMDFFAQVYDLNYLHYAKKIWPTKREQFRSHIANDLLRGDVTADRLDKEYRDISKDFRTNKMGEIWEKCSPDKGKIGYEMKLNATNNVQWDYFFSNIFKMEEIDRWIEELKNPQVPGSNISYPESNWDKIFKDAIDVAKIKPVISSLLPESPSATDWFVVHKILEEIEWLQDNTDTHFISWVNDVYGWPNKAKNFKRILPGFKKEKSLDWNTQTITSGTIALAYKDLADAIRKEFVTMKGRAIVSDNTRYFKRPDLYIHHTKQL